MMNKLLVLAAALTFLGACAPAPDVAYCQRMGTPAGNVEHGNCMQYYHKQTAWFNTDLAICNEEADVTYPRSLYDHGGRQHGRVYGGFGAGGGFGHHGGYGSRHVYVEMEPDYQHNSQVDGLRHRIILPCMQKKGWNSATNWELGRNRK